jgi:hypothetical protein
MREGFKKGAALAREEASKPEAASLAPA